MSHIIYLSLNGKKQGLISAGCSTLDSIGNRYQNGHEDQIQILSLKHSITRQQHVDHHPIQFLKPIDKSSPLLASAISSNELINAIFFFYRTNMAGQLELFYEVKLTEASITDIACVYPHSINDNEVMPYEKVFLKYRSISWNHITAGTSAYSIWDDRVY
ncbi:MULTISPECIES: Hcp family type VI secretion system effector [Photorhabdus]|uniref:Hcp family type VI secretion system effector n=2 Tax=Photorhabdus TaxID=29487 RepID=A0AAW6BHN5_9GAMM|nr:MULTISPECIES: Hcp family type VI secretion system effector [Photorhabdus]PQQ36359.1 type VI secretion system tube protein Hcp [Photorhabdus luminescens]MBS9429246.1 Hcp family type VI secretion system effector [Photorhabdus akhurstii]MCC8457630.1 Hcp family type VI secretion system effector [Photorhabdus aegyptia]MCC8463658.1 Hcp family type VI secretion system effector [Photorhabdus bodei]MDB6372220.1 Hcp family type VI secretion system effector [Photorhabdus bodei]